MLVQPVGFADDVVDLFAEVDQAIALAWLTDALVTPQYTLTPNLPVSTIATRLTRSTPLVGERPRHEFVRTTTA